MRKIILALSLLSLAGVAFQSQTLAQMGSQTNSASLEVTGPQEVGNTSMPAGNYLVTEQTTGKTYLLMVSNKGTMILGPGPAVPASSALNPAAPPAQTGTSAVKSLMQQGLQKGVTELMEKNATNSLEKFMK